MEGGKGCQTQSDLWVSLHSFLPKLHTFKVEKSVKHSNID
jgi:hypothetical protein